DSGKAGQGDLLLFTCSRSGREDLHAPSDSAQRFRRGSWPDTRRSRTAESAQPGRNVRSAQSGIGCRGDRGRNCRCRMYDLEIPFHRLVHHFIKRIFYGAGDGDELQFGIPALLGLLSTPAAFGAIELLNKYSTLFLYLMRHQFFDVYRASVPDEYFFIVYSMVVTGAVVILKWDRLFPDRQDHDNLAVLPISGRRNFIASLAALLFLAALFAFVVNGAASVMFPYAV